MRKALKSFEIIKKMYIYFVKNYRDLEPKLMICEKEDFDIIEKELKDYEQHEEILNDYGLTLANFREACLLLAMLKGEGRNIHSINKQLKALEAIEKCE